MSPYVQILAICFACAMSIVIYGTIRCKVPGFKDPLAGSLVPPPWDRFLDGWGISHFFFYMMLGYLYPRYWVFITLLGILWEVIEVSFKDHPFYLSKCSYALDSDKATGWWYGRWQDIVMNSLGMGLGIVAAKWR